MTIARTAWRAGLPDVVVHTTEKTRNAHPSCAGAKSGDREAATRLACDLLSNAALESIRRQRGGRRPLLVPVRAIEATGINLIPNAMSHEMALHTGLDVTLAIPSGPHREPRRRRRLGDYVERASRRSEVLALRPETLHSLSEKHGELLDKCWRDHVGFGIDVFTEAEAGYLLRAPSVDAIRTGMAQAGGG